MRPPPPRTLLFFVFEVSLLPGGHANLFLFMVIFRVFWEIPRFRGDTFRPRIFLCPTGFLSTDLYILSIASLLVYQLVSNISFLFVILMIAFDLFGLCCFQLVLYGPTCFAIVTLSGFLLPFLFLWPLASIISSRLFFCTFAYFTAFFLFEHLSSTPLFWFTVSLSWSTPPVLWFLFKLRAFSFFLWSFFSVFNSHLFKFLSFYFPSGSITRNRFFIDSWFSGIFVDSDFSQFLGENSRCPFLLPPISKWPYDFFTDCAFRVTPIPRVWVCPPLSPHASGSWAFC